ncbi:Hypothetical predicted protein, partial [Marmota monax]
SRFLEMKPCRRRLRLWAALTGAALVCDCSRAALASALFSPVPGSWGPSGFLCLRYLQSTADYTFSFSARSEAKEEA